MSVADLAMSSFDSMTFVSSLGRLRREANGEASAKSVAWIKSVLAAEQDSQSRYEIYTFLIVELSSYGDLDEALVIGRQQNAEFEDVNSFMTTGLILRKTGDHRVALLDFIRAYDLAEEAGELINYTFGELAREAATLSDVVTIERYCKRFLATKPTNFDCDSGLKMDWIAYACDIGVDQNLLTAVQERASSWEPRP